VGSIRKQTTKSARYQASYVGPDLRRHFAPITFDSKMIAERSPMSPPGTYGWHLVNDEVSVPGENDLTPVAMLDDFEDVRAHRVAIVGERSSSTTS
jgi:hypothetical protein